MIEFILFIAMTTPDESNLYAAFEGNAVEIVNSQTLEAAVQSAALNEYSRVTGQLSAGPTTYVVLEPHCTGGGHVCDSAINTAREACGATFVLSPHMRITYSSTPGSTTREELSREFVAGHCSTDPAPPPRTYP